MSVGQIWDEAALEALPTGESTHLEFKGSLVLDRQRTPVDKLRFMLSKQISGFANYDGCLLIIGMEDPEPGQAARCDGGVPLVIKGRQSTREWLESMIPGLVAPKLRDFDVHVVAGTETGEIPMDRGVVVIEIRPSSHAPHQARDNRYYGRIGGTTQPLGHRMVMDIANRRVHPQVELGGFFFERNTATTGDGTPYEEIRRLRFACLNTGRIVASNISGALYLPESFVVEAFRDGFKSTVDDERVWVFLFSNLTNKPRAVPQGVATYPEGLNTHRPDFSYFEPILPGTKIDLGIKLQRITPSTDCDEVLRWEVYADGAAVSKGRVNLRDIDLRDIGTITKAPNPDSSPATDEPTSWS